MMMNMSLQYPTSLFIRPSVILVAFLFSVLSVPIIASATMLGPCDHLNSWSTLRVGDRDKNISDIGPIAGLQQMIGEPDLIHQRGDSDLSGLSYFENGVFDNATKNLLIDWQVKHGIIVSRSDAEAGLIGEKTMATARKACAGSTNARGDITMPGEITHYTLYYPQRGGGFGSETSISRPKFTTRVADQALLTLLTFGPQGQSQCQDFLTGSGTVLDTNPACRFSPFDPEVLRRNGYQARDINGKDVYLTNAYRGVTIENGVATVSFNQTALPFFDNVAVSPLVRGSIERTLKQFPTISQVRFKVISFHDAAPPSERIFKGSGSDGGTDVASKIASLLAQIKTLQDLLAKLQGGTTGTGSSNLDFDFEKSCKIIKNNLWLGRTDAETNSEVSLLQRFLIESGYLNTSAPTGYYGTITADAVYRYQKEVLKWDWVTIKSGVGPQTRGAIAAGLIRMKGVDTRCWQ